MDTGGLPNNKQRDRKNIIHRYLRRCVWKNYMLTEGGIVEMNNHWPAGDVAGGSKARMFLQRKSLYKFCKNSTGNQALMVNHLWITALSPLFQTRQHTAAFIIIPKHVQCTIMSMYLSCQMYYVRNKIPYWVFGSRLRRTNQAAYLSRRSFKPFQSIAPAPSGTLTP